jgi:hypothetical protein
MNGEEKNTSKLLKSLANGISNLSSTPNIKKKKFMGWKIMENYYSQWEIIREHQGTLGKDSNRYN